MTSDEYTVIYERCERHVNEILPGLTFDVFANINDDLIEWRHYPFRMASLSAIPPHLHKYATRYSGTFVLPSGESQNHYFILPHPHFLAPKVRLLLAWIKERKHAWANYAEAYMPRGVGLSTTRVLPGVPIRYDSKEEIPERWRKYAMRMVCPDADNEVVGYQIDQRSAYFDEINGQLFNMKMKHTLERRRRDAHHEAVVAGYIPSDAQFKIGDTNPPPQNDPASRLEDAPVLIQREIIIDQPEIPVTPPTRLEEGVRLHKLYRDGIFDAADWRFVTSLVRRHTNKTDGKKKAE